MKYKIKYHYIMSDHILASPEFHHSEIVEAKTRADLDKYIKSQKDDYGNHFKKAKSKKMFGFDYTSRVGGVKVEVYKPPKVKKV